MPRGQAVSGAVTRLESLSLLARASSLTRGYTLTGTLVGELRALVARSCEVAVSGIGRVSDVHFATLHSMLRLPAERE
jgi:hypothetical protein